MFSYKILPSVTDVATMPYLFHLDEVFEDSLEILQLFSFGFNIYI